MATIENLPNPHFSKLEPNERFAIIRNCRFARRVQVKPKSVKLASREAKPKKRKTTLVGDLAGMSQEQLAMLMELMSNADTD